jgi:hypothetical protein
MNVKYPELQKSLLVITPTSSDDPTQYIPIMNSIFAAKKMVSLMSTTLIYLRESKLIVAYYLTVIFPTYNKLPTSPTEFTSNPHPPQRPFNNFWYEVNIFMLIA